MKGAESVVSEGPLRGRRLNELVEQFPEEMLGKELAVSVKGRFPLLVKFIDSRSDLSIQVHPDDEMAGRCHGEDASGKTEMWYSIRPEKDATLFAGFKRATTPEELRRRIADNTLTDILTKFTVHPGDVFLLPAGRVHAIGRGNFLVEIQQASDLTYRMYDYNRTDTDGNPRQLHVDKAIEAVDYENFTQETTNVIPDSTTVKQIARSPYFTCDLMKVEGTATVENVEAKSFLIAVCIEGEVALTHPDGTVTKLRRGETALIPACIPSVALSGFATLLLARK